MLRHRVSPSASPMTGSRGVSSTLRSIDSITHVSEYWIARPDQARRNITKGQNRIVDAPAQRGQWCALTLLANLLPLDAAGSLAAAKLPHWTLEFLWHQLACSRLVWSGSSFGKREIMMRAALILVSVGSLAAMELATPPRVAKAVNQPLTPTVGVGDSRDTLAKADRLEIPYFRNELPTQPSSFVERTPPAHATPVISKAASKIVSGNPHDAKTGKVAPARPKPRPRIADSKPGTRTTNSRTVANTDRSKAPMDVKPCRPNMFDSLLKALSLPSGCEA